MKLFVAAVVVVVAPRTATPLPWWTGASREVARQGGQWTTSPSPFAHSPEADWPPARPKIDTASGSSLSSVANSLPRSVVTTKFPSPPVSSRAARLVARPTVSAFLFCRGQWKSVHRGEQGGQRVGVRLAEEGGVQGRHGDCV